MTDTMACQKQVKRVTIIFTCIITIDDCYLLTDAIVFEVRI